MTYSKKAAIRTAVAVIATLLMTGCISGDHGVQRMAGAGFGGVAGACPDPRPEAANPGSRPRWREPWRGCFPIAGSAPRSTSSMQPAHGKRRALALAQSQYRHRGAIPPTRTYRSTG